MRDTRTFASMEQHPAGEFVMRYSGLKNEFDTILAAILPDRDHLEVLDAGCGASLCIDVGRDARMAGRETLDERIAGDLEKSDAGIMFFEPFEGSQPRKLEKKNPLLFHVHHALCSPVSVSALGRNDAGKSGSNLIGRKAAAPPAAQEQARPDGTVPRN